MKAKAQYCEDETSRQQKKWRKDLLERSCWFFPFRLWVLKIVPLSCTVRSILNFFFLTILPLYDISFTKASKTHMLIHEPWLIKIPRYCLSNFNQKLLCRLVINKSKIKSALKLAHEQNLQKTIIHLWHNPIAFATNNFQSRN